MTEICKDTLKKPVNNERMNNVHNQYVAPAL